MASTSVTTADFQEFQQQIDRQLHDHTATMQNLHHHMEQLHQRFEEFLRRVDRPPAAGGAGPRLPGGNPHDNVPVMSKLKLEMPKTDGSDPLGWLFKAQTTTTTTTQLNPTTVGSGEGVCTQTLPLLGSREAVSKRPPAQPAQKYGRLFKAHEYFIFYAVQEESRLPAISMMLEGPALDWFRWRHRNNLVTTWGDFVTQFKLRFDPLSYVDYFAILSKIQQTGSVLEYQQAFEKVLVNVTGVAETNLQSLFHAGLKPHLQHEVMILKPDSLSASFALAWELEVKHTAWTSAMPHRFNRAPAQQTTTPLLPTPGPKTPLPGTKPIAGLPIRRLSYAERKERDAKGLCYNCDEKWVKGHNCGRFLLLLEDDEGDEPAIPDFDDTILAADVSSLNSLAGVTAPRSLRLSGMISTAVVDVLIDGGSTHNFIHPSVVEKSHLPVLDVPAFRVYVGNDASLVCTQKCSNVELLLQGFTFPVDVFVLPIHGPDVVLGVQWLQLLGSVTHDYAHLTMVFSWKGKE
ncbi:unnamed protein product [Cuscuta campestris]|uniref:Retrotransposon gag domain-containing protein n=1 Tax=Cuscuta campestris TaxID=132261 RepID=A0A484MSF3_9ASTE|nr:unnamed protein product [Cuscuta campestris]